MICPSCGVPWIEGNTVCSCGATMTKRYTGILKGSRVIGVPITEEESSVDPGSMKYVRKMIKAGNDLSHKHIMILADEIDSLKKELEQYKDLFKLENLISRELENDGYKWRKGYEDLINNPVYVVIEHCIGRGVIMVGVYSDKKVASKECSKSKHYIILESYLNKGYI